MQRLDEPERTDDAAIFNVEALKQQFKPDDEEACAGIPEEVPVWTRYIESRLKQFCSR